MPIKPIQTEEAAPVRTPENTPVPGGGRWLWDSGICNWVDVTVIQDNRSVAVTEPVTDSKTNSQE